MKNPLNKRIIRELGKDWKKYLVLFLLMTFMIGIASGTFVGNDSMMASLKESFEKYNIEDGHFELKEEASGGLLAAFEKRGIKVYEQYFKDVNEVSKSPEKSEEASATIRLFKQREKVNTVCVMEGRLPDGDDEIAIDRMHADNRSIAMGDTISVSGSKLKVVGLIALSDYTCLFENNADLMFDAINFNVGVVTDSCWESIKGNIKYQYAFQYNEAPADVIEEKKMSDILVEKLAVLAASGGLTDDKDAAINPMDMAEYADDMNELKDYVPAYANQAIQFAREDLGKDLAMMNILVYVFIAVLTFVFAITTENKIREEAAVIGTLRATGYSRGELLRFYMLLPLVITFLACIAGNILGYTWFKNVAVSLYYNSYSLMTYETLWNGKAFIITTLIPLAIMILVNFIVIYRLLRLSPLKFLRRDLSTSGRKKARRLPAFSFFTRFRLRIFMQNAFDYAVLFFGIVFIMILLGFSIGLPETIKNYKTKVNENLIADYQYVLKDYKDADGGTVTTKTNGAEEYLMTNLVTAEGVRLDEGISVYGISDGSRYVSIPKTLMKGEVYISSAFHEKFGLSEGEQIVLKEKYSDKKYSFTVKGVYDYPGGLAAFMPRDNYAEIFGTKEGEFTGFLSSVEITDIDEKLIYSVVTEEDILRISNQLDHSMGFFADYISVACLIMGILIMYLLTKQLIEKNAVSISMVKVLGYENREINSLYVRLTSIVTVILTIIGAFAALLILGALFRRIMYSMTGWFNLYISPAGIGKMILICLAAYFVVAFLDMRQIKKVPLAEALKNVE